MQTVKTFAVLALVGVILGAAAATGFSPLISWYQTPGTSMMAMCPCADLAHQTISQLIHIQLYGAVIGAVLAIIIGAVVRSRRRKKTVVTVENR